MKGFCLVDIDCLRVHEEVSRDHLLEVFQRIKKDGFVRNPVVADSKTKVLLDGHHRLGALKMLGALKCPVFFVDYFSDRVRLFSRREEYADIKKEDVIKMGLSKGVFPNKTTRHFITNRLGNFRIDLGKLR